MNQEQFEKIASEAFEDEFNKIAVKMPNIKALASKAIESLKGAGSKIKSTYVNAAKDASTMPSKKGLKGAAIIGGTAGVGIGLGGMALYKAMKKD